MANTIKVCYAKFGANSSNITAVSLRGYLGYLFANDPEFHHHSTSSHHYPKVQYKKVRGDLIIVGISDYADIIFERLSQLEHIVTPTEKIPINNIQLETRLFEIKPIKTNYRFATPWLGLNEENYQKYRELQNSEKRTFLQKILVGNILSMLKGLGIRIDFRIETKISKIRSKPTIAHDNKFAGFYYDWEGNTSLPDYCGLGKSVSKGFGVIERIK